MPLRIRATIKSLVHVRVLNAFGTTAPSVRINNQNSPLRQYSYDLTFISKVIDTDVEKQGLCALSPPPPPGRSEACAEKHAVPLDTGSEPSPEAPE